MIIIIIINFTQNSTCKFTINQLLVRFYYRVGKALSQRGAALMYYKLVQVLLQSEAAFLCYQAGQLVLQNRAGITKWTNFYYKKGRQLLQSNIYMCSCTTRTIENNGIPVGKKMS